MKPRAAKVRVRGGLGGPPPLPTIVVDTREQHPYAFAPAVAHTTRAALPAGDYSLLGHEAEIAIERKSLDDFVGSVIHDRDRFFRELERLRGYAIKCVLIEASMSDVFAEPRRYTSQADACSVFGSALSIEVRMEVPVVWAGDRPHAREYVERLLLYVAKRGLKALRPDATAARAQMGTREVSL